MTTTTTTTTTTQAPAAEPTPKLFRELYQRNAQRRPEQRAYPLAPILPMDLRVGDRVQFLGLRRGPGLMRTTVRAVTEHYALCSWSNFGASNYAIISWRDGWRGPHGSWGHGAETDEQCREVLEDLERGVIEMSHRRSVYCDIAQVERGGELAFPVAPRPVDAAH